MYAALLGMIVGTVFSFTLVYGFGYWIAGKAGGMVGVGLELLMILALVMEHAGKRGQATTPADQPGAKPQLVLGGGPRQGA